MKVQTLVLAGVCLAFASATQAQTAPAKPAAAPKPAAAAKPAAKPAAPAKAAATKPGFAAPLAGTKSLGGTDVANSGPVLTRDELRACLSERETIAKRLEALEAARPALDDERKAIEVDREGVKVARDAMEAQRAKSESLSARFNEHKVKLAEFNKAMADFNASDPRPGPESERRRIGLSKQSKELNDALVVLRADAAALETEAKSVVDVYNAKVTALNERADAWNQRNAELNRTRDKIKADDTAWISNCSDRRYREDDEIAIRNGK
jgi:chromosome segregation ATPase